MDSQNNRKNRIVKILPYIPFALLLAISAALISICIWYDTTFALDFKTLLYVLTSPLSGTGTSTVYEVIAATVPAAIIAIVVCAIVFLIIHKKASERLRKILKRITAVLIILLFIFSIIFTVYTLRIPEFVKLTSGETEFYEMYYKDPNDVTITTSDEPKNLIYIYLESMESTYASVEDGGKQTENYMPRLTALARDNISFTEKADGSLGGFVSVEGTKWTIAALLATSAGIPYSFPIGNNSMSQQEYFATGLTTLGDILEDYGYTQMFLCGSEASFGGRDKYYTQHGNYHIYDLLSAREDGSVPEDYHNGFWGIEDHILFDIAKTQLAGLAAEGTPFNFTMLTVDLHHNGGFVCELCENDYEDLASRPGTHRQVANIVTCQDKLIEEFIEWCSQQSWYENTVIIITGDHPRMDYPLVNKVEYNERTIYNCIINSFAQPEGNGTTGRTWTAFDMFPTTLAAMGFDIHGERLGLGTNLFSGIPTLAEELGLDVLETEIQKQSQFYVETFSPELLD